MQLYENGFYDNSILWFKPSLTVLDFLNRHLSSLNIKGVTSIGCGTGLFEWLLHSFTGTFHGRFFGYGSNYKKKNYLVSHKKKRYNDVVVLALKSAVLMDVDRNIPLSDRRTRHASEIFQR
jgi:hypothetical protein